MISEPGQFFTKFTAKRKENTESVITSDFSSQNTCERFLLYTLLYKIYII